MISVTQALSPFIDWSQVSPERLEHAGQRGTKIHAYNAAYLLGLWLPKIESECQGYFDSFRYFADARIDRVFAVEKEVICHCFGYVGHVDFVGILKDEIGIAILDWKSPIVEGSTWRAQLAAYKHAYECEEGKEIVTRVGSIMLDPNGKPAKMVDYKESIADFAAFVAALTAFKYFKGKNATTESNRKN